MKANNHSTGQDLDLDDVEFTIGPLDHFEWDLVASPQSRGVPFTVRVEATDSNGWTVPSYIDTVELRGGVGQGTSSTIVITECGKELAEFIEVENVSQGVVDFVAWGWTASEIAGMTPNIAGHSIAIGCEFTSGGIPSFGTGSIQRQGHLDNNSAVDFSWFSPSLGTQNAGINVPFYTPVSIAPDSATFVAGVWTGDLTVLELAEDMYLRVDDDSGHVGISNTFDVIPGLGNFDFGDAPLPYPTMAGSSGAWHRLSGPTLGAARDWESDGTPSANANGDDMSGPIDDEDGVTFGSIRVGQTDAIVTVNVQDAPSGAKLDAWIDFNGDGSWGGPCERIASGLAVTEGDNAVQFEVPSWAASGETYGRFRLSTTGGLGPRGGAVDGELEGYLVMIAPPEAAAGVFVRRQAITPSWNYATSVCTADMDGDGDVDVLASPADAETILWYENHGVGDFTAHTIATSVDNARSVFAADVDGDGDMDALSASYNDAKITWYENRGPEGFAAHTVSTNAYRARAVYAADVDADGDMDVLSASSGDDKIAWYENDGNQYFSEHTISTAADSASSVFAADMDGDGDTDVLSASYRDDKIARYENDGSQHFSEHTISTTANSALSVFAADMDADGDMDVLSASRGDLEIAWYENDGSENFTTHTITPSAESAISVFAADMDGDGDTDVLSASLGDDKIAWYENDGSQHFLEHTISTTADRELSAVAADMDGDGDLDVLSASLYDDTIAWYENLAFDYGDAPAPYPTLTTDGGASHRPTGPTMGNARDDEQDGQPTLNADGDDAIGTVNDEDGVTTPPLLAPGVVGTALTVEASGTSFLNAWIDFDRDGVWESSEQVAVDVPMVAGANTVVFDVPASAVAGLTYTRLRLTSYDTGGTLGPTGPADDGEVEDYAWTIGERGDVLGTTAGNDVISVRLGVVGGAQHEVSVNGTVTRYDPAVVFSISIDGLGGKDRISVYGTDQNETARLEVGAVRVVGATYVVQAAGVEDVTVYADAGTDQVTMTGSAGSNRLYSYADYARLADSPRTFSYRVDGFDEVTVEAPGSGRNYAYLYDSPDNDVLDAGPDRVILERAVDTADATVTTATGFARAYVYATNGGNDTATLTGEADARNRFYGYADYAILTESRRSFYFYARGFDAVTGESPGSGYTYAYLHDSSGTDALAASPTSATMDRASGWSDTTANGFKRVYAYSTRGGGDTAQLTGSATGGNYYRGYPTYSTLTDGARSFYHYVRGFASVTASGSQSDTASDRAYLYDSSGADTFVGSGNSAILRDTAATAYQIEALYFDRVYARSSDRTANDTINVDDSLVYNLIRSGTW
jgi:GEVED domain-containing protein/VCBS repeat protein